MKCASHIIRRILFHTAIAVFHIVDISFCDSKISLFVLGYAFSAGGTQFEHEGANWVLFLLFRNSCYFLGGALLSLNLGGVCGGVVKDILLATMSSA